MELTAPDYVVLIVTDLRRSLEFYVDVLGLTVGHRSGPFAQLITGITRVSLYERAALEQSLGRPLVAPDPDAPGFELGFKVPDVDAAFAELKERGVAVAREPVDRPWGQRAAVFCDPDGHLIEIIEDLPME